MSDDHKIRPLDWKDIPLLHRLRDQGLCLDSRQAYTRGPNPLQTALLDALTPGRGDCTLVAPHNQSQLTAVAQASHPSRGHLARLTFLGPERAIEEDNGLRLLDAIARAVGERGAHHLLAEVNESARTFETLRRVGFAVYARQRIWRLAPEADLRDQHQDGAWQPERADHRLAINRLYHNVVPGLVQQVEPPPAGPPGGLVHHRGSELQAYLDLRPGPRGVWVQPYVHPAAEDHETLLIYSFAHLLAEHASPLYICIRSYQGWMNAALERLGLERLADQAVMVKRLAAPVKEREQIFARHLEATRPEPTAPFTPATQPEQIAGADPKTS